MGRQKHRFQRADEWALNSLVAAAAAGSFHEFQMIRSARGEVDPRHEVSEDYFQLLVKVIDGLRGPRKFLRSDFDDWFASTCSSSGHKKTKNHVRIPQLDRKGKSCFADVVWMWVNLLRSKYVEVKWRFAINHNTLFVRVFIDCRHSD